MLVTQLTSNCKCERRERLEKIEKLPRVSWRVKKATHKKNRDYKFETLQRERYSICQSVCVSVSVCVWRIRGSINRPNAISTGRTEAHVVAGFAFLFLQRAYTQYKCKHINIYTAHTRTHIQLHNKCNAGEPAQLIPAEEQKKKKAKTTKPKRKGKKHKKNLFEFQFEFRVCPWNSCEFLNKQQARRRRRTAWTIFLPDYEVLKDICPSNAYSAALVGPWSPSIVLGHLAPQNVLNMPQMDSSL